MPNIKDIFVKVQQSGKDLVEKVQKLPSDFASNRELKELRAELDAKQEELNKQLYFLGLEVYQLLCREKLSIPEVEGFYMRASELEKEVDVLELQIKQALEEAKKELTCECGQKIEKGNKFCPKCGRQLELEQIETEKESIIQALDAKKECVCGAEIKPGWTMCLECGRSVQ